MLLSPTIGVKDWVRASADACVRPFVPPPDENTPRPDPAAA